MPSPAGAIVKGKRNVPMTSAVMGPTGFRPIGSTLKCNMKNIYKNIKSNHKNL